MQAGRRAAEIEREEEHRRVAADVWRSVVLFKALRCFSLLSHSNVTKPVKEALICVSIITMDEMTCECVEFQLIVYLYLHLPQLSVSISGGGDQNLSYKRENIWLPFIRWQKLDSVPDVETNSCCVHILFLQLQKKVVACYGSLERQVKKK